MKEIFGCFGTVSSVTVEFQYHTSISKGVAHVTMESVEDAKKAVIGLNNGQIDGMFLNQNSILGKTVQVECDTGRDSTYFHFSMCYLGVTRRANPRSP